MQINHVFYLKKRYSVQNVLEFVQLNSLFSSDIYIEKKNISYNSKCVLGAVNVFFTINIGDEFSIHANGDDAEDAMKEITEFLID